MTRFYFTGNPALRNASYSVLGINATPVDGASFTHRRMFTDDTFSSLQTLPENVPNYGAFQYQALISFYSQPLAAQTISAQTWTLFGGANKSATTNTAPSIAPTLSIFRGGTSQALTIYNPATPVSAYNVNTQTVTTASGTFSGSAVTVVEGDVLLLQLWLAVPSGNPMTYTYVYGGNSTVVGSNTNPASYLECPSTILFKPPQEKFNSVDFYYRF